MSAGARHHELPEFYGDYVADKPQPQRCRSRPQASQLRRTKRID